MLVDKKRLQVHLDKSTNPQTVLHHSLGILLVFYTGKASGRLFLWTLNSGNFPVKLIFIFT